ncbi:MAG: dTMP kinase [Methanosphaera sp. rholeuAM130]|nr:MAG: dTMP kinase [Methanosphaera sp. rholeuAM130]
MYVVLEGIDGVGKSTHINLLEKFYDSKGIKTKRMAEPTDSPVGQLIRQELKNENSVNETNQQMLALLFAADRLTQKDEILKYKHNPDNLLLSDRSFYSSICYQNSYSITPKWIYQINQQIPRPDLLIILDLNEKVAMERCQGDEVFENLQFLRRTRQNYLKLLRYNNAVKVSAYGNVNQVQKEIRKVMDNRLFKG